MKAILLNPCYNPPHPRWQGDCPPIMVGQEVILDIPYKPECRPHDVVWGSMPPFRVIEQLDNDLFIGQMMMKMDDLPAGTVVEFSRKHVYDVRGDVDYQIRYQQISVGKRILEGADVGFYYNTFLDDPFHNGTFVYSAEADPHSGEEEMERISMARFAVMHPEMLTFLEKYESAIRCGDEFVPFCFQGVELPDENEYTNLFG